MPQTGSTPIQLYRSTTPGVAPSASNLTDGELGFNISDADMALYAKNASGTVKRIINNPAGLKYPTADGSAANQVLKTDGSGTLAFYALTASRALVSDGSGGLGVSTTTSTELGYVSGVTSAIQTQLNAKVAAVSSTDNAIVRFNGTSGAVQNSGAILDDSGNLGLGVTPSAWAGFTGFDLNTYGGLHAFTNMTGLAGNAYFNSGWKYKQATLASRYELSGGAHAWYTAPSGTAGNPITFTQAMTLDANGNLHVPGGGGVSTNEAFGTGALLSNTTGVYNTASGHNALYSNTTGEQNTANGRGALLSNTTGVQNTASGQAALYYNTTGNYNTASGQGALYSNTTGVSNTASGQAALFYNTTGSGNIAIGSLNSAGAYTPAFDITTQNNYICMGSSSVTNAYIKVAWTVTSDARDKMNVAPVPHGLDFVLNLKPVSYKFRWERGSDEPSGNTRYGFLAQDILALEGDSPVVVDNQDEEHLRTTNEMLIPILVKAIQDLKAEIETLKTKI